MISILEPNSAFKVSPAFKTGKVFKTKAEALVSPESRSIDDLEEIAKTIHPKPLQIVDHIKKLRK